MISSILIPVPAIANSNLSPLPYNGINTHIHYADHPYDSSRDQLKQKRRMDELERKQRNSDSY